MESSQERTDETRETKKGKQMIRFKNLYCLVEGGNVTVTKDGIDVSTNKIDLKKVNVVLKS